MSTKPRPTHMKTEKACTITFHASFNYGAVLQTFALRKVVENLGYSCDVLDYIPSFREHYFYERPRLFDRRSHPVKSVGQYVLNAWVLRNKRALRYRRFCDFLSHACRLSPKRLKTIDDLRDAADDYDTFLCGSDQIWNTGYYQKDDGYFLNFVPPEKKKIAYAPSFGVAELDADATDFVRNSLRSFHAISTRESQGRKIIRGFPGLDSQTVLDPTLLLTRDQWMEQAAPYPGIRPPYILCYFFSPELKRLANHLKKQTRWPVYFLDLKGESFFRGNVTSVYDAGPREFLTILDNATIVLTTSFHGTAFSINFNKPFVTQLLSERTSRKSVNARSLDLADRLGTSDRFFRTGMLEATDLATMDYAPVNALLSQEREHSMRFLTTALET